MSAGEKNRDASLVFANALSAAVDDALHGYHNDEEERQAHVCQQGDEPTTDGVQDATDGDQQQGDTGAGAGAGVVRNGPPRADAAGGRCTAVASIIAQQSQLLQEIKQQREKIAEAAGLFESKKVGDTFGRLSHYNHKLEVMRKNMANLKLRSDKMLKAADELGRQVGI